MWFYRASFRLFSILILTLFWNDFVDCLRSEHVSSIETNSIEIDSGEDYNSENLPTVIIYNIIDHSGKVNYGELFDILNRRVYNIKVIRDVEMHNILRKDACIKVAVRKCYKALIKARNKVCKFTYRCKSDFKEDFLEESKVSCIKEFDYSKIVSKSNNKTIKFRGAAEFMDATRRRYVEFCVPYMTRRLKLEEAKKNNNFKTSVVPHIFRNRYSESERECQKISRHKCMFACVAVTKTVCSVHKCSRRKRKFFKKTCKQICKMQYKINKYSSETDSDE